jgi:hypothetical protein
VVDLALCQLNTFQADAYRALDLNVPLRAVNDHPEIVGPAQLLDLSRTRTPIVAIQSFLDASARTTSEAKMQLLRNSVMNGLIDGVVRPTDREPFGRLIARYESEHVQILTSFQNELKNIKAGSGRPWHPGSPPRTLIDSRSFIWQCFVEDFPMHGLLRSDFNAFLSELMNDALIDETVTNTVEDANRNTTRAGIRERPPQEQAFKSRSVFHLTDRGERFILTITNPLTRTAGETAAPPA